MALKWPRFADQRVSRKQSHGDRPPAQGVCGDVRLFGGVRARRARRWRRPISTGPAATIRARRSPRAIRPIARWCASATGAAGPGASTIRPTSTSGAVCWLKSNVPARVQDNCCVSGVRGAGVVEPQQQRDRNLDRPLRRRLQEFRPQERRRRRRLQGGLHRRQQMPRLDLCAAGLCRQGRALLPEKRHQAAAAQGGVYVGRGAVEAVVPASRDPYIAR